MTLVPDYVPVVIIGNGPSALFLSFLLHGNVPYYDPVTNGPHPDQNLHQLLLPYTFSHNIGSTTTSSSCSLLDAVNDDSLLEYIRIRYSSFYSVNTNPVALLIDTLIASDESNFASLSSKQSRIKWFQNSSSNPPKKVKHLVFGSSPSPGGQWSSPSLSLPADTDCASCCGIDSNKATINYPHGPCALSHQSSDSHLSSMKTENTNNHNEFNDANDLDDNDNDNDTNDGNQSLSYAEMLSLPGYSFTEYYNKYHSSSHLKDYSRPKRQNIADYYTQYPKTLHLSDSFCSGTIVTTVDSICKNNTNTPSSTLSEKRFLVKYIYLHSPFEQHFIESSFVVLASGVFEKPLKQLQKTFDNIRNQRPWHSKASQPTSEDYDLQSPIESVSSSSSSSCLSLSDESLASDALQNDTYADTSSILSQNEHKDHTSSEKKHFTNSTSFSTTSVPPKLDYISAFNSTASSTKFLSSNTISREDLNADIQSREPSILVPKCPPKTSPSTILVVGSGVSAAEAISRCSKRGNVIHIFRWSEDDPSPLKRMSKESYAEYNKVYRLMKKGVKLQNKLFGQVVNEHDKSQASHITPAQLQQLEIPYGNHSYIGIANAQIESFSPCGKIVMALDGPSSVSPLSIPDFIIETTVSRIKICTGRSGSLEYLSPNVRKLAGLRSVNADLGSVSKTFLATVFADRQYQRSSFSAGSIHDQNFSELKKGINTFDAPNHGYNEDETISIEPHEFGSCCPPQSPQSGPQSLQPNPQTNDFTKQTKDSEKKSRNNQMSSLRLGKGLYAVGSLTGETLVRFMLGGCIWVAQDIFKRTND